MRARHRTRRGISRWQKATAVVPLALLAGAWTASLGSVGTTSAAADTGTGDPGVPAVPTTAFDSPASYTEPPALVPVKTRGPAANSPSQASVSGIPAAALTAYRRAETVLDQADPACHLSWALVAAIGRVESDHGRYGGSVLGSDGRATPGIYGIPLDGSHGTATIPDTDNGVHDKDPIWDRAVGPMQFIPSTWAVVGVDGDADGVRDPQDLDDAAIATAVHLCAGEHDLATEAGQRAAVFGYNHSDAYVYLVLSIMRSYLDGDYTEVPDGLPTATFVPARRPGSDPPDRSGDRADRDRDERGGDRPGSGDPSSPEGAPSGGGGSDTPASDGGDPQGDDPPDVPTSPETSTTNPVEQGEETLDETTQQAEESVDQTTEEVEETLLGVGAATAMCRDKLGGSLLVTEVMIQDCGTRLAGTTAAEAADLLRGAIADVIARLGLG